MECEKCKVGLALYGDYKELRMCADCGMHYKVLQGKPKLVSIAEFNRIREILDKAKENKAKLLKLFE